VDIEALRAVGRAQSRPTVPDVTDWADSLRETFDARYARANDLADDIRTGRRSQYGELASTIIRTTKHAGTRKAFHCTTCARPTSRVGKCEDCTRSYGPAA
jgi:hypothetical protein